MMNNSHPMASIAIAAGEPIVRYGIRRLFETQPDLNVAGEAANSSEAVTLILKLKPEALLLDLAVPGSGLEVLSRLASVKLCVRTLLLASAADKGQIAEAFNFGVLGVVFKGSATRLLLDGLRSIIAGQYWVGERSVPGITSALRYFAGEEQKPPQRYGLTPRELEIIATIAMGCSNKDVGSKFSITERTVKHHLTNIYDKLGVSNRLELALFAVNHHLDLSDSRTTLDQTSSEMRYAEAL